MLSVETLLNIFSSLSLIIIISLGIFVMFQVEKQKEQQITIEKLRKSLEEMDEQAKLIVRTDLELNRTQEELDKKITCLYALQLLSRTMSTTLEENQIFTRIEPTYLEDLGFEKALAFLWDNDNKKLFIHLNLGFPEEELKSIQTFIDSNNSLFLELVSNEKGLSSISNPSSVEHLPIKEKIKQIFKVDFFVIAPILPKEGSKGIFFVGTENTDIPITEGDEESISILANQLGQALENARLFEKTWRAHQELEKRVEDRTKELTHTLEELTSISQRKTDFVSSVSHELRTPLTSIKGYASILLAGKLGALPEEVRLRLEKVNKHSDELVQLVNELLDISRIESGKVTMKQEPQNLRKIVEEAIDMVSVLAKEKQIELSYVIPEDTLNILADRQQLQRVFINIINNAVKFTPSGGKINVRSKTMNNHVQIDVTDTGYGIPEDSLEKLFNEFYRVDNPINQQIKGTGLGLALVKHIIEAHKGKIWVRSKVGAGSTFSFTIPKQY